MCVCARALGVSELVEKVYIVGVASNHLINNRTMIKVFAVRTPVGYILCLNKCPKS